MKILLLGEFSGLHKDLKAGLVELGHEVTIASSGDGWKKIGSDVFFPPSGKGILHNIKRRLKLLKLVMGFRGYDVVHLVSPFIFPMNVFPRFFVFRFLKFFNKKIFLSGAGSDSFFWIQGRERLAYGPFDDALRYDIKNGKSIFLTEKYKKYNEYIADNVDGIIPIMYEYEISYKGASNLLKTIPIPIDTSKITIQPNIVGSKIVIFHGLNKYGFKGTRHVEEAFKILNSKYSDKIETIIDGKLPLNEYLKLMEKTNIVIDQTNSYSLGINGLIALAMGKIVLGGAEKESLISHNIDKTPVLNIKPDANDIVNKIEQLLSPEVDITKLSQDSRKYVEKYHSSTEIAKKYIDAWQS